MGVGRCLPAAQGFLPVYPMLGTSKEEQRGEAWPGPPAPSSTTRGGDHLERWADPVRFWNLGWGCFLMGLVLTAPVTGFVWSQNQSFKSESSSLVKE